MGAHHILFCLYSKDKERDPDHDLGQIHTFSLDEPNWVCVQVTGLAQYTVVQICAGANHSLAVDEWGSLFRDKVPARILLLEILFFITAAVSCFRKIPNS